jgi:hypothetical protein
MLYLQSHANGHTARIGVDTAWGGAIVEVSMDGVNFVNATIPGAKCNRRCMTAPTSTRGRT